MSRKKPAAQPTDPPRKRKPGKTWQEKLKGKAAPAPSPEAASDRPVIPVPAELADAANRLCAADQRGKILEAIGKDAKKDLLPALRRLTWQQWLDAGRRLDNPQFQTDAARGVLVIQLPDATRVPFAGDAPVTFIEHLFRAGIHPSILDDLEGEFTQEEVYELVSLTALAQSNREVLDRLMRAVLRALTPEELAIVIRQTMVVKLKEGFWDRMVGRLAQRPDGAEALEALVTALPAKIFPTNMAFDGNADALLTPGRGET